MKKNYKRGLTASQYSVFKSLIEKGYTAFEARVMAKELIDDYKEYSNYDDNYDDSLENDYEGLLNEPLGAYDKQIEDEFREKNNLDYWDKEYSKLNKKINVERKKRKNESA